jgi:hypothetical protein
LKPALQLFDASFWSNSSVTASSVPISSTQWPDSVEVVSSHPYDCDIRYFVVVFSWVAIAAVLNNTEADACCQSQNMDGKLVPPRTQTPESNNVIIKGFVELRLEEFAINVMFMQEQSFACDSPHLAMVGFHTIPTHRTISEATSLITHMMKSKKKK